MRWSRRTWIDKQKQRKAGKQRWKEYVEEG